VIASFFLATGGILALYMLMTYFVLGVFPDFVFTITTAVIFISGLIIMVMGLLADMIKDMRERLRVFEMQLVENFLYDKNTEPTKSDEETKE